VLALAASCQACRWSVRTEIVTCEAPAQAVLRAYQSYARVQHRPQRRHSGLGKQGPCRVRRSTQLQPRQQQLGQAPRVGLCGAEPLSGEGIDLRNPTSHGQRFMSPAGRLMLALAVGAVNLARRAGPESTGGGACGVCKAVLLRGRGIRRGHATKASHRIRGVCGCAGASV
jgi:hypothetical protein